jgi:predicted phage baseplate assembly protein
MPLFPPRLDTLRWDDLVRQGRAQLPLVAPDWTDQNASDPGIATLELLSWLTEAESYRTSAITDRERRLLLALVGYSPRPAEPATCLVRLSVTAGGVLPFTVPRGLEIIGVREGENPLSRCSTMSP